MNNEDQKAKEPEGEHYVCLGGCHGVAESPGTCQTNDCISRGSEMDKCDCADHKHHDFKMPSL